MSLLLTLALAQADFFEDTANAGLTFTHDPAPSHPSVMMVGGGTVGDFNADGWPDLFVFSGGKTPDRLFINQQDGTFQDQAVAWGLTALHCGTGAAVGDYDGDGFDDLYLCSFGDAANIGAGQNLLYHNNGNGSFTEVAVTAGVNAPSPNNDCYAAAFGDYDNDGDLDLFVAAYVFFSDGNTLYRNNGDGTFTDVTDAVGIRGALQDVRGFVPDFVDLDQDGHMDLLVIADTGTSVYLHNRGDNTFENDTWSIPDLRVPNAMGLAVADLNEDRRLDVYVSDSYYPTSGIGGNRLFIDQGSGIWSDFGRESGAYENGWGWGVASCDIDNDGWQDLIATNGWFGSWQNYPSRIFYNQAGTGFTEVAAGCGFNHYGQGRSVLRLDADKDGDQDLVLTTSNGPLAFFRNQTVNGNHWLRLRLDTRARSSLAPGGHGTRVAALVGQQWRFRHLDSGQSYLGQAENVIHLGLGAATEVRKLVIDWRDGSRSVFSHVAADQEILVRASDPRLSLTGLVAGGRADLRIEGAAPDSLLRVAISTAGPGPTQTAVGEIQVGLPFQLLALQADGDGIVSVQRPVPPAAVGLGMWLQAYDPAGGFLSNPIAEVVQ